jgi:hypothetical protein
MSDKTNDLISFVIRCASVVCALNAMAMAVIATFADNDGMFVFTADHFVKYDWINLLLASQLSILLLVAWPRLASIAAITIFAYFAVKLANGIIANLAAGRNPYSRFGPIGDFLFFLPVSGMLLVVVNLFFIAFWISTWLEQRPSR